MFRRLIVFFSLFGSAGTLICCALPALFVSLGAGAVFASLVSRFPQLIWVSEHKIAIFIFAGLSLLLGGVLQWNARTLSCPIDPEKAAVCQTSRRWSLGVYWVSLLLYCIGGFFAFVAPKLVS